MQVRPRRRGGYLHVVGGKLQLARELEVPDARAAVDPDQDVSGSTLRCTRLASRAAARPSWWRSPWRGSWYACGARGEPRASVVPVTYSMTTQRVREVADLEHRDDVAGEAAPSRRPCGAAGACRRRRWCTLIATVGAQRRVARDVHGAHPAPRRAGATQAARPARCRRPAARLEAGLTTRFRISSTNREANREANR